MRDQFILGLSSAASQKVIFAKDDAITLSEVVAIALAQETAQASTTLIRETSPSSQPTPTVNKTSGKRGKKPNSYSSQSGASQGNRPRGGGESKKKPRPNCGSSQHTAKECQHKDVECHKCHKKGHFARMCRSEAPSAIPTHNQVSQRNVHAVGPASREFIINLSINGIRHSMEFDTGCENSILAEDFWRHSLGAPALKKSSVVFTSYTNTSFRPLGELDVNIEYKGQSVTHT